MIAARTSAPPARATREARFAVVIPAYDVAAQVAGVIAGVPSWVDFIVVVDDGSRDQTREVVRGSPDPRVRLVVRERNGGVGAAMKDGYVEALRLGADVMIKMDGDGQMDPALLGPLISPILRGLADYTKGNRFRNASALRAMPRIRRYGNLGLSFLSKLASGYWGLFDPTNGYTAVRRELLEQLPLERIADDYFFEISMLVVLSVHHASVRDVPMPARYGGEGSSMAIGRVLWTFPLKLARAAVWRFWFKHFYYDLSAVALFFLAGLPLCLLGVGLGAHYWIRSFATGIPTTAGQVMLSGLPLLVGIQLLLQAFVSDVHSAPQVSQHEPLRAPSALEAVGAAATQESASSHASRAS